MTCAICPGCHDIEIDETDLCDRCTEEFASTCDCDVQRVCDRCEVAPE